MLINSEKVCFLLRQGKVNQNQEARVYCVCRNMKAVEKLCEEEGFVPGVGVDKGLFINKDLNKWRKPELSAFVDFGTEEPK